jgi:hypothetical protein
MIRGLLTAAKAPYTSLTLWNYVTCGISLPWRRF